MFQKFLSSPPTHHLPNLRHPGSPRLPTASFSIRSRNSSLRSGTISASTTMANGLEDARSWKTEVRPGLTFVVVADELLWDNFLEKG